MGKYKLKLTLGSKLLDKKKQVIKSEGGTLVEALSNLKGPDLVKTIGSLEVEMDGKKTTRMLNIPKIKMLFNEKNYYREILAKNLALFLK